MTIQIPAPTKMVRELDRIARERLTSRANVAREILLRGLAEIRVASEAKSGQPTESNRNN